MCSNGRTRPDRATRAPALSYPALFWRFLRFGIAAFGGPVAQIAMIRRVLVEEERWIDSLRFNRLLAVMQILPGPGAHELCVHLGIVARGRIGGLLAGLGFMLPGLCLMMLVGWAYQGWIVSHAAIAAALFAIQLAVLAIIARAVQRIGQHILGDTLLWAIAALAVWRMKGKWVAPLVMVTAAGAGWAINLH